MLHQLGKASLHTTSFQTGMGVVPWEMRVGGIPSPAQETPLLKRCSSKVVNYITFPVWQQTPK